MKTANHHTTVRERVSTPQQQATSRAARRAELRKMRKVQASGTTHDPRAIKFHF